MLHEKIFSIKEALLLTNTYFRQIHLTTQLLVLSKASHSYTLPPSNLVLLPQQTFTAQQGPFKLRYSRH